MQIRDPETQIGVHVTGHKMLRTYAMVESEISHMSEVHGDAFTWAASYNGGAGDTILWLRNDNTEKNLIIENIVVCNSTIRTEFVVHTPVNAAPAGTTITGVNLNFGSGKVALASAVQDETNNTQSSIITHGKLSGNMVIMPVDGAIILGYLDCLAVDFVAASTIAIATIRGYYHSAKSD